MENPSSAEVATTSSNNNVPTEEKKEEKQETSQEQKNMENPPATISSPPKPKSTIGDLSKELDRLDKIRMKEVLLAIAKEDSSFIDKIQGIINSLRARNA